jgi:large subunit ribosomal protein L1
LFNTLPSPPSRQKLETQRISRVGVDVTKVDFDKEKIAAKLNAPPLGLSGLIFWQEPRVFSQEAGAMELQINMQRNRSKRYRAAAQQVDRAKTYSLHEAVSTLKKFPSTKFDQTVTVSFRLGVDPKQSDQMVRGTCPLPHGSGKKVRVLVFAEGQAAQAAREAGAEFVGMKDLIQKCQEGFQDFDVAIATPAAMAEVRKLGKVLGPRGLMPNPRTGTVTDDTAKAVQEVKAGRVEFKLDKNGNVAVPVGKFSFEENALVENGNAVIDAVVRARPASAKGRYLEGLTISATMSPGVRVDPAPYLNV